MNEAVNVQILHVDDDSAFASLTAEMLENEEEQFTVETALSASEGLNRLAENNIECIVSDYNMPGMDGIGFLETVREEYPDLPFILFTGKGSEAVASEAISAGVTDYLQKASGTEQYELLANRIDKAVELTRAQRERKRHLDAIETTREGIALFNDAGEMIYVNEAFANIYGYDPEEMIGEHWELIYRDEDVSMVHDDIFPTLEAEGHWRGETIGVRADGSTFVEDHTLASSDGGEVVCTVQDITEHKNRKRELKEKKRRYRERLDALHSAARDLVTAETPDEVAQCGLQAASNVLEFSISAVFFESDDELEPVAVSEGADSLFEDIESLERGEAVAWEVYESGDPLRTTDVTQLDPIHNPDTPISSEIIVPLADYGVLLAGRQQEAAFDEDDFTLAQILGRNIEAALDRVIREQDLRARERNLAEKNERLESLANIVSHDLRNPVSVADGYVERARQEAGNLEALDRIEEALARMDALIEDVSTVARQNDTIEEREHVSLETVATDAWATAETKNAALEVTESTDLEVGRRRIQQLFKNLFRNAVEHGGDDVTVTIGVLENGFYVADDGPGVPQAEREDVFEPGFSTNTDGTGFGLSIVKQVAEAHDWRIQLSESENGGARFEITGVEFAGQ